MYCHIVSFLEAKSQETLAVVSVDPVINIRLQHNIVI